MILNRTANFYNVYTGSLSLLSKDDSYFTDPNTPNFKKSPRWYTQESNPSFYDPKILISGPNNRNKDIVTDIKIGKDTTVFGDSGGFQLANESVNEKNWNREIALKWSEKNANIFPILDLPVSGKTKYLDEALSYTIESAKYYADNRTREDRIILNVLSSNRSAFMKQWYDGVKEYKFDGWAFGGHDNNVKTIISGILFLVNQGEFNTDIPRPLHIFGTAAASVMPYILYAQYLLNQKDINIQLSFDSSSASSSANYGNFFIDYYSNWHGSVSNRIDWSCLNSDYETLYGCDCPICSDLTDLPYLFSKEAKDQFYMVMSLHNFYKILEHKEKLENFISLNSQGVMSSFSKELKENFAVMKKSFDATGDKSLDILNNGLNVSRKKNDLDNNFYVFSN